MKLDMANIDDLTDASVSAMQKLTSLVDLSLLYCLDYPLSGEALHELVQACPLLSTLTLHSAERRTLTRKTESRTFSRACFPVAQRCWRSGTVLEERGGALEIGRWRGGGFVELGSLAKTKYFAGFLPPVYPKQVHKVVRDRTSSYDYLFKYHVVSIFLDRSRMDQPMELCVHHPRGRGRPQTNPNKNARASCWSCLSEVTVLA